MRIFFVIPREAASNSSGAVDNGNFQCFRLLCLQKLEIRPALLYSDTESLVSFLLIPKHVTLSDPEWLFHIKFCFCACSSKFTTSPNICVVAVADIFNTYGC